MSPQGCVADKFARLTLDAFAHDRLFQGSLKSQDGLQCVLGAWPGPTISPSIDPRGVDLVTMDAYSQEGGRRSPLEIVNQDYQRVRYLSLGDLLRENRTIFLQGPIGDAAANEIVMQMLYLQYENRHQDIHLYVNSPGGSVTATLAIYDTMQFIECGVATYCVGMAASGAAILVAGGTKGKRFILPHAKMMIHQPYGAVGGQVSDIEIQAREIIETRLSLNQILADHTGQSIDVIARDTERDRYLSAQDAKNYGLVDEVVVSKKKTRTEQEPGKSS